MEGNRAVLKTFKILEVIANHKNGVTLSEIVRETKLPKSTVFDILEALYEEDAIFYKDFYRKTYVIGGKLFGIGQSYIQQSNFISIGSPLLIEFAQKYHANCYLCKRIKGRVVYVYSYSPEEYKLNPHPVGSNYKLYESLPGRVFLSYVQKEEKEEAFEEIPEHAIDKVLKSSASIKAKGFALERDTEFEVIYKIAVPVFNFENKIVGVAGFSQLRSNSEGLDELVEEFINIGKYISKKQGYNKED